MLPMSKNLPDEGEGAVKRISGCPSLFMEILQRIAYRLNSFKAYALIVSQWLYLDYLLSIYTITRLFNVV
ncbi:Uncharacterized protein APZ42_026798 [Daphnia magna]|uniref:Uncharacterized protein n=1 Tax=Daphnia magna TaxID=35525 RepID=A0A164RY35_9CRUS|nr:Uncharacterized protein APZ42_026798 [Daphnia magna]